MDGRRHLKGRSFQHLINTITHIYPPTLDGFAKETEYLWREGAAQEFDTIEEFRLWIVGRACGMTHDAGGHEEWRPEVYLGSTALADFRVWCDEKGLLGTEEQNREAGRWAKSAL